MTPENSILDFLKAYTDAIKGRKNRLADTRRGSEFETLGGFTAMLWSRQSQRNTDLFKDTRFNDATDDGLTTLIEGRFDIDRILDTAGTGVVDLTRPTTAAGAGTIWKGTRIRVLTGDHSEPKFYVVSVDTPVASTKSVVRNVPIEYTQTGLGGKIEATANECLVWDPLWDNTWTVERLVCSDGSVFENNSQYRDRTRRTLLLDRVGYREKIIETCADLGARKIYLFQSDFGGDDQDHGLNVCYIGTESFTSTTDLVNSCKVALDSVRVAGDNLQVLPMETQATQIIMNVYLVDGPSLYDTTLLYSVIRAATLQAVGTGFQFNGATISGAIYRAVPEVQEVEFVIDPTVSILSTSNGLLNFPQSLIRRVVNPSDVIVKFLSPR